MRLVYKIIFSFLVCLFFSAISHAQTIVIGKVLDEISYQPVPEVMIIVGTDTAYTDSMGVFSIINKSRKNKRLIIISNDYAPQSIPLSKKDDYNLTILLNSELPKYVKDNRKDNRAIKNVKSLDTVSNDTAKYSIIQGKFTGEVFDETTAEPIEGAMVYMRESEDGEITDSMGHFEVLFSGNTQNLQIDALGYHKIDTLIYDMGDKPAVRFLLTPYESELSGVTIYARKKRYRNKNNPAVALIRKVIDHKDQNKMLQNEDAKYETYDKMVFYVSNLPRFVYRNIFLKKFRFIFENEDTELIPRRRLMPVFLTEIISDNYYRKKDGKTGKQITSEKRLRFSGEFIESGNVTSFMDRLYDQVDIYDDQIRVLNNYFLSPISPSAPAFYKFFIQDTIELNGEKIVQLRVVPRNERDFLFEGRLFVTLGPNYAVTKANLALPKKSPVNWADELKINIGFTKQANGKYWQTESDYQVNFGLFNSKRGAVGTRYIYRRNYIPNPEIPDTVFESQKVGLENKKDTLFQKSDSFWVNERPMPLSIYENRAYRNIDSAVNMKAYKNLVKTGYVLFGGYYPITKQIETGWIYDVFGYTPIEGLKLRLGIRNNIKNTQRLLFQSYAAYGFKDQRWKYYVGTTFSLNKNYVFGFPQHNAKLSYQYDLRAPGQPMGFESQEHFIDLLNRGENRRYFYNRQFEFAYNKEFENRMTFSLSYLNLQQEAVGDLYFEKANGNQDTVRNLTTNEIGLNWRFAPNESFLKNKTERRNYENNAWIINLKGTLGINQGYANEAIHYQKIETDIRKRFTLSPLGYLRMNITGGYLFGSVPYPYLFIPPGNMTYRFRSYMYNMMNYMEFASDKYIAINLDYHMKGFILNRIPLIRPFYLREVFGLKAIYGGLNANNLPQNNSNLLLFPKNTDGQSIIHSLNKEPYVEVSVGIENILKVVRLDLVKRLTYRELPNAPNWGLRISLGFDF
ncbi:MAG TPA: DUF5686 family protein [Edaphocola sp.]|nr:DUF5686 family protein [Edaphocola sp.]